MPDLPSSLVTTLRELATVPDPIFESLMVGLRAIPPEIKQYRVFNETGSEIRDLPDKGRSIKSAAFSLLISRARSHSSVEKFVAELADTVAAAPGFDSELVKKLRSRAETILKIESLDLIAKAHDVLLEHANTFSTSRIVSDARLVFGDDVTSTPIGAVLVHMLSIVYQHGGRRDNFVVALDEKDIDHLMAVLRRAKQKQETIKKIIGESPVPYVRVV